MSAKAYTPGLRVSPETRHRVRRLLPIPGEVCVQVDDRVASEQPIAEAYMPGEITPLNIANLLALPPADVAECMLKNRGDSIQVGDVLARTRGIFGMLRSEYLSTVAGTIESISTVTGQLIIRGAAVPLQVQAYLSGRVVEVIAGEGCVIEADITLIQGIFGIGGEAFGPVRMASKTPDQELTPELILPDMNGAVVVGGARVTSEALTRARDTGVRAIVTGGIDDEDLEEFLGYSLGVAITGTEQVGLTLIMTEGFGQIAMAERTWRLLASRAGARAAVNGATQIRAGVMRPEILIPLNGPMGTTGRAGAGSLGHLDVGAPVRIIRDPYFGLLAQVRDLPLEPQVLESGSRARVLEVELDSGERVMIPRANVELIEG